jgi:hypothetical protein
MPFQTGYVCHLRVHVATQTLRKELDTARLMAVSESNVARGLADKLHRVESERSRLAAECMQLKLKAVESRMAAQKARAGAGAKVLWPWIWIGRPCSAVQCSTRAAPTPGKSFRVREDIGAGHPSVSGLKPPSCPSV